MTVVQKYGGSSVANTAKIINIADKLEKRVSNGDKVFVVLSAMGKTTDNLIKLSSEITNTPDPRELDMLLTTGEQISVSLLSMALKQKGINAKSINAFQAGILTTSDYNMARIKKIDSDYLNSLLENHDVIVVTGFQGITEEGELTTLGRGGSDTSAVALAAALGTDCEIYSDFPGIYTVDPKIHPKAKKMYSVSYDEMLEMASLGAKVLHNRSVEVAKKYGVKIYCGASFSDEEGTYVTEKTIIEKENIGNVYIEEPVVTGLSLMDKQARVTLSNLPDDYKLVHKIFERVANDGLNVDMISVINIDESIKLSFTVIEDEKHKLDKILDKFLEDYKEREIHFETGYSKVSVVGLGMRNNTGVASRFFSALDTTPVKLVTTSDIKISCLIDNQYKDQVIKNLIEEFEL